MLVVWWVRLRMGWGGRGDELMNGRARVAVVVVAGPMDMVERVAAGDGQVGSMASETSHTSLATSPVARAEVATRKWMMQVQWRQSTVWGGGTQAVQGVCCGPGKSARSKARAQTFGKRARVGLTGLPLRNTASGGGGPQAARIFGNNAARTDPARHSGRRTIVKKQGLLKSSFI